MSPDGMEIIPALRRPLPRRPLPEQGHIRPPDRPGWGIELDRSRVRRPYEERR